ncbi:hypothetical protein ACFLUM_02795 [Chloroflexota bacterium]
MKPESSVALAVTVHQTDDRLLAMVRAHLPALVDCYTAMTAFCSRETHPAIVELLQRHEVLVQTDDDVPRGIHRIGEVRRQTVRTGLQPETTHVQMCDFDRAIHWIAHYPQEMEEVVAEIPQYDLLVLGRTDRAWASHPPYQAETEPLFNKVFALVTGLLWDVGAGSRGLSRRAAHTLLTVSKEMTVGIDAEWPLLLLGRKDYRVAHRLCEGLEFETADRCGPEIRAAGGYEAWETQISSDPRRWVFRLRVALMIAEAAVRYGSDRESGRDL